MLRDRQGDHHEGRMARGPGHCAALCGKEKGRVRADQQPPRLCLSLIHIYVEYLARGPLWKLGLDFNHGTGHGVGYLSNVHERPNGIRWKIVPERQDSCIPVSYTHLDVYKRQGLILGVCNGFQALIKLGLVPGGTITEQNADAPTLTYNTIGRHISKMVNLKVVSNKSPWLAEAELGGVYVNPVSHGEGRFVASDEWLKKLLSLIHISGS